MVVGMALCPFTKPLRQRPSSLRMTLTAATTTEELSDAIDNELMLLSAGLGHVSPPPPTPETTLLVVAQPNACSYEAAVAVAAAGGDASPSPPFLHDFAAFLRMAWVAEDRIAAAGLADDIQIACFHPRAVYNLYAEGPADTAEDPAQFAIRSPLPTIHFLRARDIAAAVESNPSAANIPDVNKRRLREMGEQRVQAVWQQLMRQA